MDEYEKQSGTSEAKHEHSTSSIATRIAETVSKERTNSKRDKLCKNCLKQFSVDGPFNYAFIYGSWEIVRARKVGTTHTAVDYVVYRLFYAIILVGLTLFVIVKENDLGVFFCSKEVWVIIVQITYAFMFLQNTLAYNIHRDNVKHRQKIPERLIVIDEIEKGGHKFYIYKRLSILPTDALYNSEKAIYILYNVVATTSIAVIVSVLFEVFHAPFLRCAYAGALALADVFFAPIPIKLAHVIFPLTFIIIYAIFIYVVSVVTGHTISFLDFTGDPKASGIRLARCLANAIIVHVVLVGVGSFRDFVISLVDDSKTAKQQQSLRSQKRLARRKLMNFIEDDHGRIIGITLEKHTMNDVHALDQYIEKEGMKDKDKDDDEEDSYNSSDEEKLREGILPASLLEIKPPPPPRYPHDDNFSDERFSSSSSGRNQGDDLNAIKNIDLPSPPGSSSRQDASTETGDRRKPAKSSKIPLPYNKLGLHLKPRDSKEAIHEKFGKPIGREDESPPTPPLVQVVQKIMRKQQRKQKKIPAVEFKQEENLDETFPKSHQRMIRLVEERSKKEKLLEEKKSEYLERAKAQYKPKLSRTQVQGLKKESDKPEEGPPKNKLVGSKVIFLKPKPPPPEPVKPHVAPTTEEKDKDQRFKEFHDELTKKLMLEKERRMMMAEKQKYNLKIAEAEAAARARKKKHEHSVTPSNLKRPKSILVRDNRADDERSQKRQEKLVKRRMERNILGKRGKAVYDPLMTPKIEHDTTFHILGTKYSEKATANETQVKPEELPLYKQHPGIGTTTLPDGIAEEPNETAEGGEEKEVPPGGKSLVAFHPVVRYYAVNEHNTLAEKKKKKWSKSHGQKK